MTVVSVPQLMVPDPAIVNTVGAITFTSFLIDAAAEKVAIVFRVPKTGTLGRVGFRTNTVTTGDTVKVSFQDVDTTTGDPDAGVDQFRTVAIADTDDNVWVRTGLLTSDGSDSGTKRSVTRGQILAVVIEYNAYVAGNLNIGAWALQNARGPWTGGPAYVDHFTAAWAKNSGVVPIVAIEYDDGSFAYITGTLPILTLANTSYNSGSTPDELALKFKLPAACSVSGFWLFGGASTVSSDFDVVLYDSDGTSVLSSVSIDGNILPTTGTGGISACFPAPVMLSANTFYRLSMKPTTANLVTLHNYTFTTAHGVAIMDQLSGGQNFHWSSRTDLGAWTGDDTSRRPAMGLVIDGIDDGASVGGVSRAAVVNAGG